MHPMPVIMNSPKSSKIPDNTFTTQSKYILISGNQRGFIQTNVESVQSISTLYSSSHTMFVNTVNSSSYPSHSLPTKLWQPLCCRLNTSMSPHKCKPKILHFYSDTNSIYRENRSTWRKKRILDTNLWFLQNPHLNGNKFLPETNCHCTESDSL